MCYVRPFLRSLLLIVIVALASATAIRAAALPQAREVGGSSAAASKPVDINTASLDKLMTVPGLTRTWAARIIRYRPYRGKNELLDRGIVNAEVYARIKDHIVAHRIRN
jgi:DNA uptake protein ComE-like DNA-binding protein